MSLLFHRRLALHPTGGVVPIVVASLMAPLLLVAAQGFDPRLAAAQPSPTHVVAQLGSNCLEGFFWPGDVQVSVMLKDSNGNVVYPAPGILP